MSANSRAGRGTWWALTPADVTRVARDLLADKTHCPGCGMIAPHIVPNHASRCRPLRQMARDKDRADTARIR